ncbi:hypothetical protein HDU93_004886 [Gonapodya sp. JEL0774]|nr:hypothetical protein HDU93_004886 [Gonapodya sp. JEL0774]
MHLLRRKIEDKKSLIYCLKDAITWRKNAEIAFERKKARHTKQKEQQIAAWQDWQLIYSYAAKELLDGGNGQLPSPHNALSEARVKAESIAAETAAELLRLNEELRATEMLIEAEDAAELLHLNEEQRATEMLIEAEKFGASDALTSANVAPQASDAQRGSMSGQSSSLRSNVMQIADHRNQSLSDTHGLRHPVATAFLLHTET